MKKFFKFTALNLLLISSVLAIIIFVITFVFTKLNLHGYNVFITPLYLLPIIGVLISIFLITIIILKKIFGLFSFENGRKVKKLIKNEQARAKKVIDSKQTSDFISLIKQHPFQSVMIVLLIITIFSLHNPNKYNYEDDVLRKLRSIESSVSSNSNKLFQMGKKLNSIDNEIDKLERKQSFLDDKIDDVLSYVGWIYDRLGGN